MPAIVTTELTKVFREVGKKPVHSLDRLNLEVPEGEVYGFLGRNGAGKTTTIKLICGLLKATSGGARIFGGDARLPESRRLAGYLPEQPYFYEYLSPRETVEFYGRLRGLGPAERRAQWDRLAPMLELEEIADRRIRGFSKGMRQRVGFAVALVGDPPLLILDEPMSGLDPLGRRMIRQLILRLRGGGKTIFFSSHVLSDVEELCDRVGILVEGRLRLSGRVDALPGRRTKEVEVAAAGLSAEAVAGITAGASEHRRAGDTDVFNAPDLATANKIAAAVAGTGGQLLSLQPVRESLEEYFARVQQAESPTQKPRGNGS